MVRISPHLPRQEVAKNRHLLSIGVHSIAAARER
jgi:hypothetical protein